MLSHISCMCQRHGFHLNGTVLSVPKRIRYYLQHDPKVQNLTLHIFMSAIEQALRGSSPGASKDSRCGAVAFIHHFGALLNEHLALHSLRSHFHCVVLEGVFSGGEDGQTIFHPATDLHAPAFDEVQSAPRRRPGWTICNAFGFAAPNATEEHLRTLARRGAPTTIGTYSARVVSRYR